MDLDFTLSPGSVAVINARVSAVPSIPIINSQNMTSVLQGDGRYLVTKTSADAYDGSVILGDAQILEGDFTISIQPSGVSNWFVGIDALINGNHSNITIDYALNGNGLNDLYHTQNNSVVQGPTAMGADTVFFMRRVGTSVSFLKGTSDNIALATGFGTPVTKAGAMYFASAFYQLGSSHRLRVTEP